MATTDDHMQTEDLSRHLLDLETRFWNSTRDKNADAAMSLTDDHCIVTGSQGIAQIDKKVALNAADASTWVKKNGNWVCALHTESLAADPAKH